MHTYMLLDRDQEVLPIWDKALQPGEISFAVYRERFTVIPMVEMFNTFNNKNNINPLTTPALFNFVGFLRSGVGDPRQAQLAVRFTF